MRLLTSCSATFLFAATKTCRQLSSELSSTKQRFHQKFLPRSPPVLVPTVTMFLLLFLCCVSEQRCNAEQFACRSGKMQCIPMSWQCDGWTACEDKSDEMDCPRECSAALLSPHRCCLGAIRRRCPARKIDSQSFPKKKKKNCHLTMKFHCFRPIE